MGDSELLRWLERAVGSNHIVMIQRSITNKVRGGVSLRDAVRIEKPKWTDGVTRVVGGGGPIGHAETPMIVCPFCGATSDGGRKPATAAGGVTECTVCAKRFRWSRQRLVTYTTTKLAPGE